MKIKSSTQAFTLIELLVVVAIISLLSSVVLAALKDARDKAKQKAFRSEMQQLINALELYKADNSIYPGEGTNYTHTHRQGNGGNGWTLDELLLPYLAKLPQTPNPTTGAGLPVWSYKTNYPSAISYYKCSDSEIIPTYVITVRNIDTTAFNAVSDWGLTQSSSDGITWFTSSVSPADGKCFSLK